MATLTELEDRLSMAQAEAQVIISQLHYLRHRLQDSNTQPQHRQKYQENTLLQEVLIQAEDIIKIIHYRYHNRNLNSDAE